MNKLIIIVLLFILFSSARACAQDENFVQPKPKLNYNYLDTTSVPIYVSIVDEISTKSEIFEGQWVDFRVLKDVTHENKIILEKGTIIQGRIETIVTSGMNGFPAEIIVDSFKIPEIKISQLISTYIKKGQNRSFIVYPLKWALTLIPFVGSLTNLIMGGHARIKTSDVITIYYYPNWN
ncbi:MAG: hypothetical protein ACI37Q_00650 [Candidatus Gastranaerophilaceae bacterium]